MARWKAGLAAASLLGGAVAVIGGMTSGAAIAASGSSGNASSHASSNSAVAQACGPPAAGRAKCHAVKLLDPAQNWRPAAARNGQSPNPASSGNSPGSGYDPGDLESAYGVSGVASGMSAGPSSPTIAVVDANDDPSALSDLITYRSTMSGSNYSGTGIGSPAIPPICSGSPTNGCITFRKVFPGGSTPAPDPGWSSEISVDLDMVSAVCPDCNITLVEASSATYSDLDGAVSYAEHNLSPAPAAVTNSYGGSEFFGESSYNTEYSAQGNTAVTVATGDGGYGVEFPSAAPGVTAVGGTSLTYSTDSSNNFVSWDPQTVWSGAGSGCSKDEAMPSWQNVQNVYDVSSTCNPTSSSGRETGDVSAVADPSTGVAVYSTYGDGGWVVYGGTSVSAQIIGAMYGLAATGTMAPSPSHLYTGGVNPRLVPVTSGSNGNGKCSGTYLCDASYSLTAGGYNGPTGLGTPNGIAAFQSAAPAGSLSFNPSSVGPVTAGSPTSIAVDLTPKASGTVNVTVNTSSGGVSTFSSGPWSSSLPLSAPSGASTAGSFYFRGTTAGTANLTASATNWSSAGMSVTVNPGNLATITVSPSSATVAERANQAFSATGVDAFNNPVNGFSPSWASALGTFSPAPGSSTTFTAGTTTGTGPVTASQSGVSSKNASVTVTTLPSMNVSVTFGSESSKRGTYSRSLKVTARNGSSAAISGASVTLSVYAGACPVSGSPSPTSSFHGTTGSGGTYSANFSTKSHPATWCAVANVTASGYSPGSSSTTFTT